MSDAVAAALITGVLSLVGIIITVAVSNKSLVAKMDKQSAISDEKINGEIAVVKTEVQQLRGEVQKHNNFIERTYKLEQQSAVHEEQIKVINHRISDLEQSKVS